MAMHSWSRELHCSGRTLALVPTMGALHEGHRSLLRVARESADAVIASIFVNPAQFESGEDYQSYPRSMDADLAICVQEGVDAIYVPSPETVYAADHSTWVVEEALARPMEGEFRSGHFRGVLTVVLKLFHAIEPDVAVFGQKDAQQALLIRRMVRDLDVPIEIRVAPTIREKDGLALSSRNRFLKAEERRQAAALYKALTACHQRWEAGEQDPDKIRAIGLKVLEPCAALKVQYLEIADLESLALPLRNGHPVILSGAVLVGGTRLIDNIVYPPGALAGGTQGAASS
jgi:pantoate--beta-alanine ligase